MNELDGHYSVDREAGDRKTLDSLLHEQLRTPRNQINLFVTGVQQVRCVMKGSVHATEKGYNVYAVQDLIEGGHETERDNWREGEMGIRPLRWTHHRPIRAARPAPVVR